jgi:diguanylate cyclase (GGDEF)-like protein
MRCKMSVLSRENDLSPFAYEPLFWMGQTLGFVIMAAAMGIWRQVAIVGGTSLGTKPMWASIIAMMSMQAGARFMLGLSGQFDAILAIPMGESGISGGPFMLSSLVVAAVSMPAMWPMLQRGASSCVKSVKWAGFIATACSGAAICACVALSNNVDEFLNLSAAWTIGGSALCMLIMSRGVKIAGIAKVKIIIVLVLGIGAVFGWAGIHPGASAMMASTGAAVFGSMIVLVGLHIRIRDISRGMVESSVVRGAVYGGLSWMMLGAIGPILWESASRPDGVYRDYMMSMGLLGALFTISWHFRQLGVAVAAYVERLGRDQSKALLQGIDVAAFLLDEKNVVIECSKGALSMAKASLGQVVGKTPWEVLGVAGGMIGKFDRVDANGRELVFTWATLGAEGANASSQSVLTVRDVTTERQTKMALDKAAREDDLTGLPNRREALAIVDQAIEASRGIDVLGLLFLDLDHFKNVNDTEGHAAGDALLREVAVILESCLVEAGGWLARLGGDEFLGVIPGADESECELAALKCVEAMERSQRAVKGSVGVSVGVALFPRDGDTGLDLIRRADAAMYESKSGGRGRVSFFGSAIEDRLRRRVQVEGFLREALRVEQGLALELQPLCGMDGSYLRQAEALIRAPGMPGLGAQELIIIAEQSGMIMQLGRWVLRQAVAIQREHERKGSLVVISINVSAKQFMDDLFWEQFRGMARLGQFQNGITLEVTETTLMEDQKRAARLLQEARALGAKIALDDFGAGYSSLSSLKNMPLDKLKLDKSLLDFVPEDQEARRVAQAAIAMASALGLEIVAEGVERPEQAQWLHENGVQVAQGYLFAKPMAPPLLLALSLSGQKHFHGEPKAAPAPP